MGGTGIDITPTHSLAIQLEKDGAQYRLRRIAILPGYEHHPEREPRLCADTLFGRGVQQLPSAMRKSVVVSMPGKELVFRSVDIGNDSPSAVRALVNLELDELSGGNVESMVAGHQITTGRGGRKLIMGVTRLELIEHLGRSLRSAGLPECTHVPNAIALFHTHLVSGEFDFDGIQMLVHLGESSTDIVIVEVGDLLTTRTLSFGIHEFTSELSQALGVNKEQARETLFTKVNIRPGVSKDNVTDERAVSTVQDVAGRFYQQLTAAIAHARAQTRNPRLEPGRISLCGSGAAIRGMREFLMSRFKKTVELLDPVSGFDVSSLSQESIASLQNFSSALAVPLGLAKIAAEGDQVAAIRLVAPGTIARKTFYGRTLWLYAAAILLLVSLGLSYWLLLDARSVAQEAQKEARATRASYETHSRQMRTSNVPSKAPLTRRFGAMPSVQQSQAMASQKLLETWRVRVPSVLGLRLANELTQLLPEQISLESIRFESADAEDENPDMAVVRTDLFIESGVRSSKDVLSSFVVRLNDEFVRGSGIARRIISYGPDDSAVADGSGSKAKLTFFLMDATTLLPGASLEGKE